MWQLSQLPASFMAEHALLVKADPPNPAQLPQDDIVGVTVMLLTCSYNQQVSMSGH